MSSGHSNVHLSSGRTEMSIGHSNVHLSNGPNEMSVGHFAEVLDISLNYHRKWPQSEQEKMDKNLVAKPKLWHMRLLFRDCLLNQTTSRHTSQFNHTSLLHLNTKISLYFISRKRAQHILPHSMCNVLVFNKGPSYVCGPYKVMQCLKVYTLGIMYFLWYFRIKSHA